MSFWLNPDTGKVERVPGDFRGKAEECGDDGEEPDLPA